MKKNTLILLSGAIALLLILGYLLYPKEEASEYIFDNSHQIRLKDVQENRKALPRQAQAGATTEAGAPQPGPGIDGGLDLKAIFKDGLINSYTTLRYFKHLEHQFRKSETQGDHLDGVKKLLFAEFSPQEAQTLFDTYRNYLQCEMDLADEFKNLTSAKSTAEAIEILKKIHEFRRERLGVELADKLFGADVKAKEYAFRRAAIVGDESLNGDTKMTMLQQLNTDMWGEEAEAVERHPNPYNRYREKLLIYKKDLNALGSEARREEKIREYRKEFFTPEQVARLDAVDRQLAQEQKTEALYREKERKIMADTGLTEESRQEKIEALQNEMFGKEADAFRRRETMRLELERMGREKQTEVKK